jgi:hypothetical protein
MTAQGAIPDKSGRGRKAQREDSQHDEEGTTADVSRSSDEGMTARETQVRVDDLSEIAHKPDD